jgi:DNA-directed RNA polymerase specialized sigma24 family protein
VTASLDQKTFERGFRQLFGYESAGEEYLNIWSELVFYFRHQLDPQELANEVLDRMIRKAAKDGVEISGNIRPYALRVAWYVRLEYLKKTPEVTAYDLDQFQRHEQEDTSKREILLQLLEESLEELTEDDRELILRYFDPDNLGQKKIQQRRKLAADLGTTLNSLRVRAHRVRLSLAKKIKRKLKAIEGSRTT